MAGKSKIILVALLSPLLLAATKEGDDLIGTKPPEWQVRDWINSKPLKLADLKRQGRPGSMVDGRRLSVL